MEVDSFKYFMMNEAVFSAQKMQKALKLIVKILQRRVGRKFKQYPGVYQYTCQGKRCAGIRYFLSGTLKSVRFSWEPGSGEIAAFDVWDGHGDPDKPTIHVDLRQKNVVQILDGIVGLIKKPRVGNIDVKLKESLDEDETALDLIIEKKLSANTLAFIQHKGIDQEEFVANQPRFRLDLLKFIRQLKKSGTDLTGKSGESFETLRAQNGREEINLDPAFKKAETMLARTIDVPTLFDDLETVVKSVTKKINNSLVVTGNAGTGKSFTVMKVVERSGREWVLEKGAATAFGLYGLLFKHRDKLIVFDDSDDVFANQKARNILKGALDSSAKRMISWPSRLTQDIDPDEITDEDMEKGKFPSKFDFEGQIIFISNLPLSKVDPDGAIQSRSLAIDITLTKKEIIDRMESILFKIPLELPAGFKQPSDKFKQQVFDVLRERVNELRKALSIRTFVTALKLRMTEEKDWERRMIMYA